MRKKRERGNNDKGKGRESEKKKKERKEILMTISERGQKRGGEEMREI